MLCYVVNSINISYCYVLLLFSIIVIFSDEEIGGLVGMKPFVNSPEFKKLNVGFAFDEGMASPDDSFQFFYGERSIWRKLQTISN